MAYRTYMSLKGAKQGQLTGVSPQLKRNDWIEIVSFGQGSQVPRDVSTGMATGKRLHAPITIIKAFDASSPLLIQAHRTGETFSELVLEVVESSGPASDRMVDRIVLKNASIVDIRPHIGPSSPGLVLSDFTFVYEQEDGAAGTTIARSAQGSRGSRVGLSDMSIKKVIDVSTPKLN